MERTCVPEADPEPTRKGWAPGSELEEERKKDERAGEEASSRTCSPQIAALSSLDLSPVLYPWTLSLSRASGSRIRKSLMWSPRGYHVVPTSRISSLRNASIGYPHTPRQPLPGNGVGLDFSHASLPHEGVGTHWKTPCPLWCPDPLNILIHPDPYLAGQQLP